MNNKIDPKTGQFLPTPKGAKTPRMLEVERKLGRTLEEDFEEFYNQKGWGKKRLANRWGVKRNLIFSLNMRGGRRSWGDMLNLKVRREAIALSSMVLEVCCELCEITGVQLDNAHWVSDKQGGSSASFNIIKLCPNCHRLLDRDNPETISKCRELLLFREAKKLLDNGKDTTAKKKRLLELSEAIIARKLL